MPYQYFDDSKRPFVHVDLEAYPELRLDKAVELIRESGQYARPLLPWLPDRQFHDQDANLLSPPASRLAPNPLAALVIAETHPGAATFVIATDLSQIQHYDRVSLGRQLRNTALAAEDREQPGKRLVWVTRGPGAGPIVDGLHQGSGRFVSTDAPAVVSVGLDEFTKAIGEAATNGAWEFGDDPEGKWIEYIEKLNETQIRRIVDAGFHRPAIDRVREAMVQTRGRFVGRDCAIEIMVACALARINVVLLGPPGTAKSLIVRTFCRFLGVRSDSRPIADETMAANEAQDAIGRARSKHFRRRMFEYLLTRYTTPEEIFGGADVSLLLSAGVHGRRTEGMLPRAETAFLDELFKANSAILNALLSITNERLFYNMGQAFKVRLAFVVGASNETPDEQELGALYDRFPIRVPCRYVGGVDLQEVIKKAHKFETDDQLSSPDAAISRVACLNDVRLLTKVVQGGVYGGPVAFPDSQRDFNEQFMAMLRTLRTDYNISDRTPVQILRLCRALALLEEGGPAERLLTPHLRAWGYVAPKMTSSVDLQLLVRSRIQPGNLGNLRLFDE